MPTEVDQTREIGKLLAAVGTGIGLVAMFIMWQAERGAKKYRKAKKKG
jgi:hypothetical protein